MSLHFVLSTKFKQVLHIYLYLKKYYNTQLVFDPSDSDIKKLNLNFRIGFQVSLEINLKKVSTQYTKS